MKVAFLSFHFGEYSVRLASALAQETRVLLLLPCEKAAPHLSRLDPAVNFRPFNKPRLRQPLRQLGTIFRILQEIRRFDPDVIHLQRGHLWFNLALPLLRHYPLVITIHDPRPHVGDRESQKVPQTIWNFGRRRADQLIVHGQQLKQVVLDELSLSSEMVQVIPMIALGDDLAQPQVQEIDHQVLFFGRIWGYKGLEYLIQAEPLITAQVPEARIVIAGRGEDFGRYRRLMIHPERFTVYNEYVSDDKRAELFRRASVVALPYVDASQSAVIPVAYTFGKPVVATTVGGLPELVEHGHTGFLVPPRDERALADAVVRLLRDKELRHQLGANGRRKVDTECSPDAVAQRTLEVYRCALDACRTPRRTR
ncbi:MAG: glycosyltransferase family 4 protein [Anaerolineae bacterium]|jgi:glycosyltransferase involved in cell wall biosynthesis